MGLLSHLYLYVQISSLYSDLAYNYLMMLKICYYRFAPLNHSNTPRPLISHNIRMITTAQLKTVFGPGFIGTYLLIAHPNNPIRAATMITVTILIIFCF